MRNGPSGGEPPSGGPGAGAGSDRPSRLVFWLLAALAAALLATSLYEWRPAHAGHLLREAFAAGFVALASLLGGMPAARALRRHGVAPLEAAVHAFALGAGAIVLAILGLGLLGALTPAAVLAPLVLALLAGAWRPRSLARALAEAWEAVRPASWSGGALLAATGAALFLPVLPSLLPTSFYDALLYHLEAPELWLRSGRLAAVPYNFYLNYPLNMSVLYAAVRAIDPAPAMSPALLHAFFLAASTLAIVALARPLGARTALLAGLLFAASPSALETAAYPIADHAVVLWTLAAAAALLAYLERDPEATAAAPRGGWALLAVAGLELGLAAGAKYTALLVGAVPALVLLAHGGPRRPLRRRLAEAAVLTSALALALAPWLLRNGRETGNPLYPYFFAAREPFVPHHSFTAEVAQRLPAGAGAARFLAHLAQGPRELLTTGAGVAPLPGLGLLLPLPFLLLRRRPFPARVARLLVLGGVGFLLWDATVHVTRYALPFLALLAAPAAWAAASGRPGLHRRALLGLTGAAVLQGVFLGALALDWGRTFALLRGRLTPEGVLSGSVRYYDAVKWASASLGPRDRILFVGEARGYYCRVPHVTVATTRPTLLVEASEAAPGDVGGWLKARGFTHVLASRHEMERIMLEVGPRIFESARPEARDALDRFLAAGVDRVYSDENGLTVLKIR